MSYLDLVAELNDGNGYPTNEGIRALRVFEGTPSQLVEVLTMTFGKMGRVAAEPPQKDDFDREFIEVYLATGGWSGNEEMISALQHSFFWFSYWEMSKRGGAFTFHVPVGKWDKPMIAWPPAIAKNEQDS